MTVEKADSVHLDVSTCWYKYLEVAKDAAPIFNFAALTLEGLKIKITLFLVELLYRKINFAIITHKTRTDCVFTCPWKVVKTNP